MEIGPTSSQPSARPPGMGAAPRVLLVSSAYSEPTMPSHLGREAYSYRFVYQAFAPLLRRWATTIDLDRPQRDLKRAVAEALRRGQQPIHLSFLPPQLMPLAAGVPNVMAPSWEFPHVPDSDLAGDPGHNWARQAEKVALILTHTRFARDAFLRTGVRTPVHVVPVPLGPRYFTLPDWRPQQRVVIDCPCYLFPRTSNSDDKGTRGQGDKGTEEAGTAPVTLSPGHLVPLSSAKPLARAVRAGLAVCKAAIRPLVPGPVRRFSRGLQGAGLAACAAFRESVLARLDGPPAPALDLSGVVFTTILNHHDPRKNWRDLLTAYLLALKDQEDATLVVKLVLRKETTVVGLREVLTVYQRLGIRHRCRLAFVAAYLSEPQLLDLARASTFYLNSSHAEGSCLPLQSYLAAGRPGIAPAHTGMADSVGEDSSLVVASHPEPAAWPQDPQRRLATTWHRLVWQSLHDQVQAGYRLAREDLGRYRTLAERGRERMRRLAAPEAVWPLLEAALNVVNPRGVQRRAG